MFKSIEEFGCKFFSGLKRHIVVNMRLNCQPSSHPEQMVTVKEAGQGGVDAPTLAHLVGNESSTNHYETHLEHTLGTHQCIFKSFISKE